jgi:cell division septum initiation protein DivIVA
MPDMTIAETAQALGYSADTIRRGVVKGAGPLAELLRDAGRKGNDGQWIVRLSDEQIAQHRKPASVSQPTPPQATPAYASPSSPEPADQSSIGQHEGVLLERIAGLERRLADRDTEMARQADEVARIRTEMAERDAAHRVERAELLASAAAERERLLAMLERATERPPSVVERLLAIIRPKGDR